MNEIENYLLLSEGIVKKNVPERIEEEMKEVGFRRTAEGAEIETGTET